MHEEALVQSRDRKGAVGSIYHFPVAHPQPLAPPPPAGGESKAAVDPDTHIGGAQDRFPSTRRSAIAGVRSSDAAERSRSSEILVSAYWKPVYKYIRRRWGKSNEDAKDLTQSFFTRALEKDFFASYDPAQAAFRTFLRSCLDHFLASEHQAAGRRKRGGGVLPVPLDFETAEGELATYDVPDSLTTEEYFRRESVRSLFTLAVERLRDECESQGKHVSFQLFERYDLDTAGSLTYAQLAAEFGLPVTTVTNYLAFARRGFRRLVLGQLREISGSEEEFRAEARAILGVEPP
jgi:RNA polymerase sigma factor (sigma-70 family)